MTNSPSPKSKQSPAAVSAALTIIAALIMAFASGAAPFLGTIAVTLAVSAVVLAVLSLREE